jgi:hypothetical protein
MVLAVVQMVSCGGEKEAVVEEPVFEEHDGAQLVALMAGAREAMQAKDANSFRAQFKDATDARAVWAKMERLTWLQGDWHINRVAAYPQLERAQTVLRVDRLYLHLWFDLSRETGSQGDVYETSWEFVRDDSLWAIRNLRLDKASTNYHALIRDLFRMGYEQYLALNMDWEEAADPGPLFHRWLVAVGSEDAAALASRSVAGVYARAHEKNIDLPSLSDGDTFAGETSRQSASTMIETQAASIQEACVQLGIKPVELIRYFGAYRITSVPKECTRIKMYAVFSDVEIPGSDVRQFSTEWSAVYINNRWLVEDMVVKGLKTGG